MLANANAAWSGVMRRNRSRSPPAKKVFFAEVMMTPRMVSRSAVRRSSEIWRRDFTGACGLFGVVYKPAPRAAFAAMIDNYRLFGIGASWGGFESLVMPTLLTRTATSWAPAGPVARYHIGLEDPDDLIADLEAGFERLRAASKAAAE